MIKVTDILMAKVFCTFGDLLITNFEALQNVIVIMDSFVTSC